MQSGEAQRKGKTNRTYRVQAGKQTNRRTDTVNVQSSEAQRKGNMKRTYSVQAGKQADKQVDIHDKCAV